MFGLTLIQSRRLRELEAQVAKLMADRNRMAPLVAREAINAVIRICWRKLVQKGSNDSGTIDYYEAPNTPGVRVLVMPSLRKMIFDDEYDQIETLCVYFEDGIIETTDMAMIRSWFWRLVQARSGVIIPPDADLYK